MNVDVEIVVEIGLVLRKCQNLGLTYGHHPQWYLLSTHESHCDVLQH